MVKYAIIVAGGTGTRMENETPKQFLLINGKPILYYSIKSFLDTWSDCKIVVVSHQDHIAKVQEIIDAFFDYTKIEIAVGGRTRFHSVQNGLAKIADDDCLIFVHDAARPLINEALILRCFAGAIEMGTAIPVVKVKDSVRQLNEQHSEAIDRNNIVLVQTPQAFHSKILLPAFKIDYKDKFTDEASVIEAYGLNVHLVEGDEKNIKITQPNDLKIAEALM
jgi:2-C-methyl-D-erythritol 4-phosphate cytidylyltransferase